MPKVTHPSYIFINHPIRRGKTSKIKEDPLLVFDRALRDGLLQNFKKVYQEDWWPRQGSEAEALMLTFGTGEFLQGVIEEEDCFRREWEEG